MDEQGVSEIIGEMLLLALVLIIVAVLSSNVLGILPSFESTPYAKFFGIRDGSGNITIFHEGGDAISLENLKIVIFSESKQINCNISEKKLYCNGREFGSFSGEEFWGLGDTLLIYNESLSEEFSSERFQISLVSGSNMICKLYFGW